MTTSSVAGDKYRSNMSKEELNTTQWNDGSPNYDVVNKLFEQGRTKEWAAGSLEEYVQNLIKTWEMELVHKANPDEYKTLDPKKFVIGVNGKKYFTLEEVGKIGGGYNLFLQTSLPQALRFYDPDKETNDSSQTAFRQAFPRGFAFEVVQVYSGPPMIAYKYRHWGYFEGSFKGYPPTGEIIEVFGIAIFEYAACVLALSAHTSSKWRRPYIGILSVLIALPAFYIHAQSCAQLFQIRMKLATTFDNFQLVFSFLFLCFLVKTMSPPLNEESKLVKVEFFHDRGELLAGFMKGGSTSSESMGSDGKASSRPSMA